jgi:hypothetical protein
MLPRSRLCYSTPRETPREAGGKLGRRSRGQAAAWVWEHRLGE